jgi:hypothetical protein
MGGAEGRRAKYEAKRVDGEFWQNALFEFWIPEFAAETPLMEAFGVESDSIDLLFVYAEIERSVRHLMWMLINFELEEASWNEIAAALGVSRQAAVKRFGPDSKLRS